MALNEDEFLKAISKKDLKDFGGDFDKYSNHTKQEIFNYMVEECRKQNPQIVKEEWIKIIKEEYRRERMDLSFLEVKPNEKNNFSNQYF